MDESKILEKILRIGRKIIPKNIFRAAQPIYHYLLAIMGAVIYRFPAKKLVIIGVTGTKGKSTTVELVNAILEKAGYKTALASTIRYKINQKTWPNKFKMTLRGRFFGQSFLRQALDQGCTHVIMEISSEGVPQSRHKFLFLDALIFTNLAKEHIESHGSYEKYREAKIKIAKELEHSDYHKNQNLNSEPVIVANIDDQEAPKFLNLTIKNKIGYSLNDVVGVKTSEQGSSFQINKVVIHSKLPGLFNVSNMLGAIAYARFIGINDEVIKEALEGIDMIRGRMEKINCGQKFEVVVDYAHTPESLKAVYETYNQKNYYLICILGNTGGGRDTWKRPEMGKIADQYCDQIILTNEDPYDEDPAKIINDVRLGIKNKPTEIIMDRRTAIATAITKAESSENQKTAVLITGKGTDPYIMEANGKKTPWDDATVAREELNKMLPTN